MKSIRMIVDMKVANMRTAGVPDNIDEYLEIYHKNTYALLSIFIKFVGGSHCRPSKADTTTYLKFMNWLLSENIEFLGFDKERNDLLIIKNKLKWILPILRKCNGDVNFTDKNGQSIFFIFLTKYVSSFQSLKKDELHRVKDALTKLLEEGISVDCINADGNTPLHIVAKQEGNASIIKIMLERFVNVNVCDKNGNTVLHILLKRNRRQQDHTQNIDILVSKGADVHKLNQQGSSPVHLAVERCNVEVLRIFEKNGVDFSLSKKFGRTMLHLACDDIWDKSTDKLRETTIDLLMSHNCDINATDWDGYTPLHHAAHHCSSNIIMKLIELGADKLCRTKKYGYVPFHLAVKFGRSHAINTLFDIGVDVDVVAESGITPLHLAILFSEWSWEKGVIEFLIKRGADVHRRETIFDFSPMHMAAFSNVEVLDLLIRHGLDVNITTSKGITPLHLASMIGSIEVMNALIDRGADLHCRDGIIESTPLHWVSRKNSILTLESLATNGENLLGSNKIIKDFWTPLFVRGHRSYGDLHEMISIHGHDVIGKVNLQPDNQILETLLRLGAFVNQKDDHQHLPLYHVLVNNNIEGLKSMLEFGGDVNDVEISEMVVEYSDVLRSRLYACKDSEAVAKVNQSFLGRKEVFLTIVTKHVVKLKAANFPIAPIYEYHVEKEGLWKYRNDDSLKICRETCANEVEKLKAHAIDDRISLYDFLHMDVDRRSNFAQNVMTLNLSTKFPEYCNIIRNSCREAMERRNLLKIAKSGLYFISGSYLPDLCVDSILSSLDNESLRTLTDVSKYNVSSTLDEILQE